MGSARTGSPAVNLFSQTSDEQPQICSGSVRPERRRALELGPPPGDGGASAHGLERGHRAGTCDKAQQGLGNRPEHGDCHHPAPSRKQWSSTNRSKVGTEPGGKLGAGSRTSAADLHRPYVPRIRLFCGQDAECFEDAHRLQNLSWGQEIHREREDGQSEGEPVSTCRDEEVHCQLLQGGEVELSFSLPVYFLPPAEVLQAVGIFKTFG